MECYFKPKNKTEITKTQQGYGTTYRGRERQWCGPGEQLGGFFLLFVYLFYHGFVCEEGVGRGGGKAEGGRGRKERKLGSRQGLFVFSAVYGRLAGL